MNISLSVIIPTYRRPKLLFRCLTALMEQHFDKGRYEIIVVSDGPDNETFNLLKEWPGTDYPSLRLLQLPEKKGPAAARNLGWMNAQGDVVAFTDDDCVPDRYWLHEIHKHCHGTNPVAITGRVIVPVSGQPTDYELNTLNLQTADFITANCACTRAALLRAGGFDEQFMMAWREDSDLHFKLINNNIPIRRIESAIVTHPVREADWGVSVKEQKKTMYDALLFKKHPALFRSKIRPVSPLLYYGIIGAFTLMCGAVLSSDQTTALFGLGIWLLLTAVFIHRRLLNTSRSAVHITEMVTTSLLIPFVSVYWQWRGALKYKVLFI